MFLAILIKRVLPFILASVLGVFAYYFVIPIEVPPPNAVVVTGQGSGSGSSYCRGFGSKGSSQWGRSEPIAERPGVKVLSKPQATFTEAARANNTQGSVRLKVTLLSTGEVGNIRPITELPDGLTEQAIAAARKIKFEPKRVNGKPVSTTVTIDYSFEIY